MSEKKAPAAKVETLPFLQEGDIVTAGKVDYFVDGDTRRGSISLIRTSDLREGFTLPLASVRSSRKATDEERGKFYDMKIKKLEATQAYRTGALVKPSKPSAKIKADSLYVIIKVNAKTVSIVELGGNASGAYLTAPTALLDIVKPEDVLK